MAFDNTKTYTGPIAAGDAGVVNMTNAPFLQRSTAALRPTAGNAGVLHWATDTNVLSYDTGVVWVTIPTSHFQEFESSDTWTKPSGVTTVIVECVSGGGGGGGGGRVTNGQSAGGGGGGGTISRKIFDANDLGATEVVTVGAGGTHGDGNVGGGGTGGNSGGNSDFGTKLYAYGGGDYR